MTIRLLIADDHEWVREGLRYAFANTGIEIVAEASTGKSAASLALEVEVDVVLLDIKMPDGDGMDALSRIKAAKGNLPVLIYSAHDRPDYVQRCASLGASGYLRKGVDNQVLVAAVRDAFAGQEVWDGVATTLNDER